MATDQLSLYNLALTVYLGERRLASLTENREPRRALDDVWTGGGGAVKACLEQGHWKFAQRTSKIDYTASIAPTFGYRYGFTIPSDQVRVSKMCSDEYLNEPLLHYADEAGVWYSDIQTIYVSYVSSHASFGGDMSLWPESFTNFVACYLAQRIATRITGTETKEEKLTKKCQTLLVDARSKDAMQGPTQFTPSGSWVRARHTSGPARDGGSRSNLIG